MLNNGGNQAFEIINKHLNEPLRSVLLLESVLRSAPEKAREILMEFLPPAVMSEVLRLVFSPPKDPVYFVVDPSMQFKIVAISYLGNWDFSKVYVAHMFKGQEKDKITDYLIKLGRNPQAVQRIYQEAFLISGQAMDNWVSRPFQFYSGIFRGQLKGDTVLFDNGFTYNPNEQTISTNVRQIPRSLFVFKNDNLTEYVYTNANLGFSVLVYKVENEYRAVLLDASLARSMFVRMYYLGGQGLRYFKSHIDAQEGSDYIRVFRLSW